MYESSPAKSDKILINSFIEAHCTCRCFIISPLPSAGNRIFRNRLKAILYICRMTEYPDAVKPAHGIVIVEKIVHVGNPVNTEGVTEKAVNDKPGITVANTIAPIFMSVSWQTVRLNLKHSVINFKI